MLNARRVSKNALLAFALISLLAAVHSPSEVSAAAGGVQNCTVGSSCVIGEFLFDDNSAPINNATCTITSWYPNDTPFFATATPMTPPTQSDGWYSKSFTAPSTTGMYRTQVTCTVSAEDLSIDKSFQVNAESTSTAPDVNSIAAAVWSYSGRTVSSFGDLISNIWNNATRTLTGANLSGGGQLATQDDVTSVRNQVTNITNTTTATGDLAHIKKTVDQNRLLLEQVVNKPIIENVLEESVPPLTDKINNTRAVANQLYVNNQFLTVQSATLASKWNSMTGKEALEAVISISNVLGESADSSNVSTMFGNANWVKDSWRWDEGDNVYDQLSLLSKNIETLKDGLANYQKTPALYTQAKLLVKNSLALEKTIGAAGDISTKATLFSKIKNTEALAMNLEDRATDINKTLADYTKSKDATGIYPKLGELQNQVIALNKIPGVANAITHASLSNPVSITNNLLSLRGVVASNQRLLSLGSGKTMVNVWLEVGSIIFKTVATNPSNLIAQKVDIKYYLPPEIKQEDIIKTDAGLEIKYDAEKNQLYAEGTFNLNAGQTRTFSIETKDIWLISQTEIDSLRSQADELSKPLEKTAFYAQGVSLKSDINAALDRMTLIQADTATPEDKILAYREAQVLKSSVDEKLAGLRDLVGQASAASNLFGFVGGSQTIAVWGLIIIIAAGFIFISVYMKTVISKEKKAKLVVSKIDKADHHPHPTVGFLRLAAIVLVTGLVSAGGSGFLVSKIVSRTYEQKLSVLGTQSVATPAPSPTTTEPQTNKITTEDTGTGGQYLVVIGETPTGFLRVRKTPGGLEMAQVKPGDKLPFVEENKGWYQISLENGDIGWVSKEFSTKE